MKKVKLYINSKILMAIYYITLYNNNNNNKDTKNNVINLIRETTHIY